MRMKRSRLGVFEIVCWSWLEGGIIIICFSKKLSTYFRFGVHLIDHIIKDKAVMNRSISKNSVVLRERKASFLKFLIHSMLLLELNFEKSNCVNGIVLHLLCTFYEFSIPNACKENVYMKYLW